MKRTHTKLNTAEGQTKRFGVGMLSPTVVILLIMTAYPLIFTFFYSFTNYNLLQSALAGQDHLLPELCQAAPRDPYFQQSIWNTVKFTIFAVIFLRCSSALQWHCSSTACTKGQKTMRTLLLLPLSAADRYGSAELAHDALPQLRHRQSGPAGAPPAGLQLVFRYSHGVRHARPHRRMAERTVRVPAAVRSAQSVPQGQYEAARIDGANSLKILFYVTIPNIKNSLALCALLRTIDSFLSVRQGKPADRRRPRQQHLHHHAKYLYNYGIKSSRLRLSAALAPSS